jgi:hypothetical protein
VRLCWTLWTVLAPLSGSLPTRSSRGESEGLYRLGMIVVLSVARRAVRLLSRSAFVKPSALPEVGDGLFGNHEKCCGEGGARRADARPSRSRC